MKHQATGHALTPSDLRHVTIRESFPIECSQHKKAADQALGVPEPPQGLAPVQWPETEKQKPAGRESWREGIFSLSFPLSSSIWHRRTIP